MVRRSLRQHRAAVSEGSQSHVGTELVSKKLMNYHFDVAKLFRVPFTRDEREVKMAQGAASAGGRKFPQTQRDQLALQTGGAQAAPAGLKASAQQAVRPEVEQTLPFTPCLS